MVHLKKKKKRKKDKKKDKMQKSARGRKQATGSYEYCFWQRTAKKVLWWKNMGASVTLSHTPPSSPALFSHSGVKVISCDMRKHVLRLSVLCWLPSSASLDLPHQTQCLLPPPTPPATPTQIRRAYKHQNAIRPSKTPPVPRLAGPLPSGPALLSSPGHRLFLNPLGLFSLSPRPL